jgi:hypothetical protein
MNMEEDIISYIKVDNIRLTTDICYVESRRTLIHLVVTHVPSECPFHDEVRHLRGTWCSIPGDDRRNV